MAGIDCWGVKFFVLYMSAVFLIISGSLLFFTSVGLVVEIPAFEVGSSVWTGSWAVLNGLLVFVLTEQTHLKVPSHRLVILLSLLITSVIHIVNLVLLKANEFTLPHNLVISKSEYSEKHVILMQYILVITTALGFVNCFLAGQFVFLFVLTSDTEPLSHSNFNDNVSGEGWMGLNNESTRIVEPDLEKGNKLALIHNFKGGLDINQDSFNPSHSTLSPLMKVSPLGSVKDLKQEAELQVYHL